MGLTHATSRNADVGSTSEPSVKIISRLEALDDVREVRPKLRVWYLKNLLQRAYLCKAPWRLKEAIDLQFPIKI